MTRVAQGHEVFIIIPTAFTEWNNVVNKFSSSETTFFQALLTEWVLISVPFAYLLPRGAISFLGLSVTSIAFILSVVFFVLAVVVGVAIFSSPEVQQELSNVLNR